MKKLILLFTFLLPVIATAEDDVVDVELTVKPLLCITDNRNPSCDMVFVAVWESAETGYYCLFNDFDEAPLRCWRDEQDGSTTDERTVAENFSFWMTGEDLAARLAQVDVEVLRLDSDDRRRSRRGRHVWDIN
jgi:hypothetical protein